MNSDVEAVARGAIQAINDRTLQARAPELLDPSMVRHDLVQLFPDSRGASEGSDVVRMMIAAMPDFRLEIEEIFCTEDRAAVRLLMTGVHTGQPLLGRPAAGAKLSASAIFHLPRSGRTDHRSVANDRWVGILPPRRAPELVDGGNRGLTVRLPCSNRCGCPSGCHEWRMRPRHGDSLLRQDPRSKAIDTRTRR